MKSKTHRSLVSYLRRQAGDYLRGVVIYTTDDYDVLYLRDDLHVQQFNEKTERMCNHLKQETRTREQRALPFDGFHGTIRFFEEAMVMHYPHTQERGTVITLEPEVGRNLTSFMHECEKRITY